MDHLIEDFIPVQSVFKFSQFCWELTTGKAKSSHVDPLRLQTLAGDNGLRGVSWKGRRTRKMERVPILTAAFIIQGKIMKIEERSLQSQNLQWFP